MEGSLVAPDHVDVVLPHPVDPQVPDGQPLLLEASLSGHAREAVFRGMMLASIRWSPSTVKAMRTASSTASVI